MSNSVKGHSAFSRPATIGLETAAFIMDLGLSLCIFFMALRLFGISLIPHWNWLIFVPLLFVLSVAAQKRFARRTLGERVWSIRALAVDQEGRDWKLFQIQNYGPLQWFRGIFLTASSWIFALFILQNAYEGNPRWLRSEIWKLQPFMPQIGSPQEGISWHVLPYFYTLGAWPNLYDEKPIFHSLPYKKGPPNVFLEEVTAYWRNPDIKITYEGPKTPEGHRTDPKDSSYRTKIRRCLGPTWTTPLLDWSCTRLREQVLSRHVQEIEKIKPQKWVLRWFIVENPALPPNEQAQGFYLRAEAALQFQSRFVIITPHGTHQALILNGSKSPEGIRAEEIFHRAMGSLRVSNDLNPGRAWIDRQLQSVDLGKILSSAMTESTVTQLSKVQALLLSKLTVNAGSFDSYYHLGGTALLMLKLAEKTNQSDWSVNAKSMVSSAYRYAKDIAPKDPRLPKLQNIWLDAEKY